MNKIRLLSLLCFFSFIIFLSPVFCMEGESEEVVVSDSSIGSEEDLDKMQKEIDEYLASLTPQEREEFDKAVEELSKAYVEEAQKLSAGEAESSKPESEESTMPEISEEESTEKEPTMGMETEESEMPAILEEEEVGEETETSD